VLVFAQVRRSTWGCGTAERYMVRRRSTVRFRKGAPGYDAFSKAEPSTSFRRVAFECHTSFRGGACDQAFCCAAERVLSGDRCEVKLGASSLICVLRRVTTVMALRRHVSTDCRFRAGGVRAKREGGGVHIALFGALRCRDRTGASVARPRDYMCIRRQPWTRHRSQPFRESLAGTATTIATSRTSLTMRRSRPPAGRATGFSAVTPDKQGDTGHRWQT
jgi:hypothetical protein